jgi:hypothetical protein
MPFLRSATTNSPVVIADGTSEIDNHSQPNILPDTKTDIQRHPQKNTMSPQQNFISGKIFLSEKLEEDSDDQYTQPDEIDTDVQNSNLF